jgi:hypothetical protein
MNDKGLILLCIILFSSFTLAGQTTDERLAHMESDIKHIAENIARIDKTLESNHDILYGKDGSNGMITSIRLNTEHRQISAKLAWLLVTAVIMNTGSMIYMAVKHLRKPVPKAGNKH